MSETWAVVDEAGVIHEARVREPATGGRWRVVEVDGGRYEVSPDYTPRASVAFVVAQFTSWQGVEVLAPGQASAAQLRAVAQAAATLVLWHDANTPDGDLNDADGHMWSMIDALRAAGYEMPTGTPTGPTREEMAAEVAHLEARRGALIAEVDRLTAALAAGRIDGARAALPKAPVCECGAAASGTRYVGSGSDGPHRTPCCRAHGGETYEVARG